MSRSSSATYNNLHEENPSAYTSRGDYSTRDYNDNRNYTTSRNRSSSVDEGTHSGKWTSAKELSDRDMNRRDSSQDAPSDWNINVGPMFPRNNYHQSYDNSYDYENNQNTLSSLFHKGGSRTSSRDYDRDYDRSHTTSTYAPRTAYTTSHVAYPHQQVYTTGYSTGYHPQTYGSHAGGFTGLGSFLTQHPNTHPVGSSDYYRPTQTTYSRGFDNNNFIDFDDYSYGSQGLGHSSYPTQGLGSRFGSYGAHPSQFGSFGQGSHRYGQQGGLASFLVSNPNPHPLGGSDFSDSYNTSSRGYSSGQHLGLGSFITSNPNPHPLGGDFSGSRGFGGFGSSGLGLGQSHGQYTGLGSFLTQHPNPHPIGGDFGFPGQRQSRGFSNTNPFSNQYNQYGDSSSFGSFGGYPQQSGLRNKQHKIDMYQVAEEYVIELDLPGFSRDSVEIKYLNNELIISAKPPVNNISNFMQRERKSREVSRRVQMPTGINVSGITAVLSNGVLKVTVPRDNSSTLGSSIATTTF